MFVSSRSGQRSASFLAAALAVLVLPALAVEPKREFYVVNVKPPSVAVADAKELKITAEIPLDGEPSYALTDKSGGYLYVLEDGLFRANGLLKPGYGKLAVVDLGSRKLLKTIPLGWGTKNVALSKDGRYLICLSLGKANSKDKRREDQATVTILDTAKNEVTASLSGGRLATQVVYNSDVSRLAVLSAGMPAVKKKGTPAIKPAVTIFALDQEKPLAEIEFDRASEIALSSDEKWLYVLDKGVPSKKPAQFKDGAVNVIDLAEAKLVKTHDAGVWPQELFVDTDDGTLSVLASNAIKDPKGRLYRFRGAELEDSVELGRDPQFIRGIGSQQGHLVVTLDDMRLVSGASPSNGFVALNQPKGAPAAGVKTLGGNVPGEVLHVPQQNKLAMTLQSRYGVPTSKVALVDLKTNRVENVVTTGRGSVKFGTFMGAMALSVAMTSLSYYANYSVAASTGQPYFFYQVYVFTPAAPNIELTSSPDGQFVYALNTQTNDVTIIKVADGSVVDRIAVGGNCKRVALAPGGRFVYSYTPGQLDLIDTSTNKKHLEHKLESGKINALHVIERDKRIAALTSNAVLFWDSESGAAAGKIEGLHQPFLLVEPGLVQ